ncbi:MAG: alpha/beta hydrolase [Victivallales bacterium]|nr:alpha/beta hydrolase [Victivallales bacterium]
MAGSRFSANPAVIVSNDELTILRLPSQWHFQMIWALAKPNVALLEPPDEARQAMENAVSPQCADAEWDLYTDGQGSGWEKQGVVNPCGLGVLRQRISLPGDLVPRQRWYLVLPGVDEDCWIYLDGKPLAEQSRKSTGMTAEEMWNHPLVCEVTGEIVKDTEVLLALGIFNRAGMGGLYTGAYLVGADRELTAGEVVTALPEGNPYGYSMIFKRKYGPADRTGKLQDAIQDSWTPYRQGVLEKRPGYAVTVLEYGDHPQQQIYLSMPKSHPSGACPVIVWYHGGGLVGDGSDAPRQLWDGNLAVAEVRYRTVGVEFTALDCLEDATAALAWLLDHIAEYGGDPRRVFIGGISAGGWLSGMVGMNPNLLAKHGHSNQELLGLVLVTGQMTTHFQLKVDLRYTRRGTTPVIDEYAPIYWISKDVPPVVCITGSEGYDWPGRPAENAYMVQMLKVFGHPDATHIVLDGFTHAATGENCGYSVMQFINRLLK